MQGELAAPHESRGTPWCQPHVYRYTSPSAVHHPQKHPPAIGHLLTHSSSTAEANLTGASACALTGMRPNFSCTIILVDRQAGASAPDERV